jgi:hypothetical protein
LALEGDKKPKIVIFLSDRRMPTCDTTAQRARIPMKGFYEIKGKKFEDDEFSQG